LVLVLVLGGAPALWAQGDASLSRLLEEERYEEALELIETQIASTTADVFDLQFQRARLLLATGQSEKAEEAYRSLITRYPARPEPYNNLGKIYAAQGKLDQAAALLRAGLFTDPNYRTLYDNLSQIYSEQAARSLRSALDPSDPKAESALPLRSLSEIKPSAASTSE
jgi:tetratricopeptide (TPR) repeat protein